MHTEPPISVIPEDPEDPNRIPSFPNDLFGGDHRARPPKEDGDRWYSRLFRFFANGGR